MGVGVGVRFGVAGGGGSKQTVIAIVWEGNTRVASSRAIGGRSGLIASILNKEKIKRLVVCFIFVRVTSSFSWFYLFFSFFSRLFLSHFIKSPMSKPTILRTSSVSNWGHVANK